MINPSGGQKKLRWKQKKLIDMETKETKQIKKEEVKEAKEESKKKAKVGIPIIDIGMAHRQCVDGVKLYQLLQENSIDEKLFVVKKCQDGNQENFLR